MLLIDVCYNNDFSNKDFSNNEVSVCEAAPAPNDMKAYGEFDNVRLTDTEHDKLVFAYGEAKTADYINRLDSHIASVGKHYKSHYATIKKWVDEDDRQSSRTSIGAKCAPAGCVPQSKPNKFVNFEQRKIDFSEIERRERELLLRTQ